MSTLPGPADFAVSADFLGCLFDGVVAVRNGRVTWANDAAKKLLGVTDNIAGAALNQLSPEAEGIVGSADSARFHFWRQRIDPATSISRRDLFIADTRWIPGQDNDGQLIFRDASDLAIVEKRLINTTFKDDRSGLLTAVGFIDLADTTFSRTRRPDRFSLVVAMYVPDLINFETEPVVHASVIRDIAVRMCYALRGNDLAAYLGQSEFAVMLNNVSQLDQALSVIKRFASRVSAPFEHKGSLVRLRALLGIAIQGLDGEGAKPLLQAASRASAEGSLEDSRHFYSITFANKDMQRKSERDAARAAQLRHHVLNGEIPFAFSYHQGEEGKACLICPALPGFSEQEIWAAHEAEDRAQNLVRQAIESAATIESDFFVISYPQQHSKIANNAMALLAAERAIPLTRFFSCHPDASWANNPGAQRLAARWDGKVSLSTLRTAGVTMLLVPDAGDDALLAAEISVARQFFKSFTCRQAQ